MTTIPPPGVHGGDGARLAAVLGVPADAVLDLSQSLNPVAPDVAALVRRHAATVARYPDAGAATEALAGALDVDPERVVLTNGGSEAIALVAGAHPVGRVDEPDFSLYARHLGRVRADAPRWRSNPHNPSGRLAAPDERAAVWDEAFYPLATGTWSRSDDAIVVGSLTKVFACPGLRAGYVVCPAGAQATALRARQPEWSVNGIACAIVPELLEQADLEKWRDQIAGLRAELVRLLAGVGLTPEPSDACFVLVPLAPGLRVHLASNAVLVRDTATFGIVGGARIAVPDADGLTRLASALKGYER